MIVAPSILSADFGNLARDIQMVNESQAEWIHLDIMDGVFVPNISYGFPVVKAIAKEAKKVLDAHLMIIDPDRYVERFAELGVDYLSVHYEACTHLHRSLQNIRNKGMKAGVALNPHTPVILLEDIIQECDYVLLMSVNPGFGGQKFIENAVKKVSDLKELILKKGASALIEVDGGVNRVNAPVLAKAGVDIVVAGSSVFNAEDPKREIIALQNIL